MSLIPKSDLDLIHSTGKQMCSATVTYGTSSVVGVCSFGARLMPIVSDTHINSQVAFRVILQNDEIADWTIQEEKTNLGVVSEFVSGSYRVAEVKSKNPYSTTLIFRKR